VFFGLFFLFFFEDRGVFFFFFFLGFFVGGGGFPAAFSERRGKGAESSLPLLAGGKTCREGKPQGNDISFHQERERKRNNLIS